MTNMDKHLKTEQPETYGGSLQSGSLDREIDSALKQYSAEPRAGLEDRILANLRTKRERNPTHNWLHWAAVPALVTLLFAASILFWRSTQPTHHYAARLSQTTRDNAGNRIPVASSQGAHKALTLQSTSQRKKPGARSPRHSAALAAGPKLDQFPSPRPLTEQEKILKRYISDFPEDAILVARARAAEARLEDFGKDSDGSISNGEEDSQR